MMIRSDGGVPARFSRESLALVQPFCTDWEYLKHMPKMTLPAFPQIGRRCSESCGCFLLWGDSHAMGLCPAIDAVARDEGLPGVAALIGGTVPLPGFLRPGDIEGPLGGHAGKTDIWGDLVVEWIRDCRPRHVLLCARWSVHVAKVTTYDGRVLRHEAATAALKDSLARLQAVCSESGTHLWLLLEVPDQVGMPDPRQRVLAWQWLGRSLSPLGVNRQTHASAQSCVQRLFDPLADERLHIFDLAEPFFDGDGISHVGPESGPWWYADTNHISPRGAQDLMEPVLRPLLRRIAADCALPVEASPPSGR
jgi:hypothetical protein